MPAHRDPIRLYLHALAAGDDALAEALLAAFGRDSPLARRVARAARARERQRALACRVGRRAVTALMDRLGLRAAD